MADGDRFNILSRVVEIANTSVDAGERLDGILATVIRHLGAQGAILYMRQHDTGQLARANSRPKELEQRPSPTAVAHETRLGEAALGRKPLLLSNEEARADALLAPVAGTSEAAVLLPVMDDNRCYGVLALLMPEDQGLPPEQLQLVQSVAREMAGTVRNHNLYMEAKRRIAELNVISDLGKAAVSTIEIDQLLNTVASMCAKLLGARGGIVCITGRNGPGGWIKASHGVVPEECVGSDGCQRQCQGDVRQADCQQLCADLSFKGTYQGHICVFEKMALAKGAPPGFNSEDQKLMRAMASMISSALENALTFQRMEELAERNEEMVGALATLHEISTVLMTTVDFDELVLIVLHSVIHPSGLDFDRAVLFLADERQEVIRPVAKLTKDAAAGQYSELTKTLLEVTRSHPDLPGLDQGPMADLEVPLDKTGGVLGRTLTGGKPIHADSPQEAGANPPLIQALGDTPFVTVPMFAKGKSVGVLMADNNICNRPVAERDIKLLAMLANQGALALETSRLYQHLENANRELAQMRNRLLEADKLAALGEIAAGVAHEIRNPLVSIGGFTRRIRKKVGDNAEISPYLDVIIEESTRLERTLNEMLDFSGERQDHFDEHSLNDIVEEALGLLQRDLRDQGIKVQREYGGDLPSVYVDDRQIKHVFLNLYLNAIQAMGQGGGTLRVRTFTIVRDGQQFVAGEVSDTGGGISMEVIHNIFNPFFTTKDTGSGLGLSIVHKIITRHFGQVEVHNREGEGASFLVTLPAAAEGRAYYLK